MLPNRTPRRPESRIDRVRVVSGRKLSIGACRRIPPPGSEGLRQKQSLILPHGPRRGFQCGKDERRYGSANVTLNRYFPSSLQRHPRPIAKATFWLPSISADSRLSFGASVLLCRPLAAHRLPACSSRKSAATVKIVVRVSVPLLPSVFTLSDISDTLFDPERLFDCDFFSVISRPS